MAEPEPFVALGEALLAADDAPGAAARPGVKAAVGSVEEDIVAMCTKRREQAFKASCAWARRTKSAKHLPQRGLLRRIVGEERQRGGHVVVQSHLRVARCVCIRE